MIDSTEDRSFPDPKDDPRPVGELISVILSDPDDEGSWDAVSALHWRGTREVLDRAVGLSRSGCAIERRAGAQILGQIGVPDRTFPEECLRALLSLLEIEANQVVLGSVLIALSHLGASEAIQPAYRHRNHADPDVRYGVVLVMMGHDVRLALEALIELSRDSEAHVRDWATFALGSQVEVDSPELREALVERLADEDDDARAEAMVGMARRGDRRMIPVLRDELALDYVGRMAVEAAFLIGDPSLHPLLVALQGWWDVDEALLADAIRACCPGPKVTR